MAVEGIHGNRGLVPSSPSVRLLFLPALPATDATGPVWKGVRVMEVVHERCAGLDISNKDAKVCVRVAGSDRRKTIETVTTWGSTTTQVLALRDHLVAQRVTCAVMEATGDYWKPFYLLLEDAGFEVQLVNARHVKNLPGRKTDVSDATWLALLGAHGLVRRSSRNLPTGTCSQCPAPVSTTASARSPVNSPTRSPVRSSTSQITPTSSPGLGLGGAQELRRRGLLAEGHSCVTTRPSHKPGRWIGAQANAA